MKSIIPLFLIILIITSCNEENVKPLDLANQIVAKFESKNSLSYDINYRIKFFNQLDDTTKVSANIDLIRQNNDTIFGGYVWIKSDSMARYYDTRNTYFINHRNQSITKYPKEKPFAITGNTLDETIRIYFLKPRRLINGVTDSTINITLTEDKLNGIDTWKLAYKFDDDQYSSNTWKDIWIEKESNFIPKMRYSSDMQGENQYNQWELSNLTYNDITIDDLKNRFEEIKSNYTIEDYKERSKEELSLLANGVQIPKLTGTRYLDGAEFSLDDYKGKMILLDFWYLDCFPCIKAISHLNEIQSKYKDLVIIGANPFDNNEKGMKRMPNFLSHNPINYPIMFIERTKPKDFKIFAYPSFYLIDKEGKIIHSEIGFSEDATSKIDSLIQINL